MMVSFVALAAGAWSALRVPLWLRERRLRHLLDPMRQVGAAPADDPSRALVWAHVLLCRLARLPHSPWRSTCLYHSIAECLVLRAYGVPSHIQIGVRTAGSSAREIAAHAWVVRDHSGRAAAEGPPTAMGYEPFRRVHAS